MRSKTLTKNNVSRSYH